MPLLESATRFLAREAFPGGHEMMERIANASPRRKARIAGVFFLLTKLTVRARCIRLRALRDAAHASRSLGAVREAAAHFPRRLA